MADFFYPFLFNTYVTFLSWLSIILPSLFLSVIFLCVSVRHWAQCTNRVPS